MKDVLVSIIMSVYNGEKYLKESIESIINDNFQEWECIICNDNSTDNTKDILNYYCKKDKRFKVINLNKNVGAAIARNIALKESKGKYIAILDSDDLNCKSRLEKQYLFLEKNKKYSFVGSLAYIFDDNGKWKQNSYTGEITDINIAKGMPFIHSTLMARLEDIKEINFYPNYRRIQDYSMIMNLYSKNKGYILDEYLVEYRKDENNYKRRTFKSRIEEVYIRYVGYKKCKIPYYMRLYLFKPIIAGMIPSYIMKKYHKLKGA
ncbi:glycosyltransferase family 2 protein [uncultured Clostridium sp.]|uniref:glycosyltransferase family 2 protein n=1 Tax=uncultured Clostridium sp. TaxID=59620 RepID=UPI00258F4440|nr:glycosyltransferase family 2 protein [uncultured Clostridium sp.]